MKRMNHKWPKVRLADVCRVVSGTTPKSGVKEYWNGDIVWVTPTDLGRLEHPYITGSGRMITQEGYDSCGTEIVPPGTVVMSSRAPIGHLGIAHVPLCTNQGCKSFVPGNEIDSVFLYYALKHAVPVLQALGSGATFAEISKSQLEKFEIPLPPLSEQKRIAAILTEQMAAVEKAQTAAKKQLDIVRELKVAYLRSIFLVPLGHQWPNKPLGDICDLLPAKSIATNGDTEVATVTTACLTESGFQSAGIKRAKMWAQDVPDCTLRRGEILIARSNTEELVGRVSLFPGEPQGIVASDLIIRIWPKQAVSSEFLAAYLSFLYSSKYWKQRAGGASGSMKKITRSQIKELQVPIPIQAEQTRITAYLQGQMTNIDRLETSLKAQYESINQLPKILLHRAFSGEL